MYRWDARDYQNNSPNQQQWGRELLLKLNLQGNERVLDIGCGDGKVTAEIASYLPKGSVLGIDSSEDMVSLARQSYPPAAFPNIAFTVSDAGNLGFSNEFDVVFSNATLHWVIDHLPVLDGIKRSLRPSGRVLLQMGGKGNAAEILHVLETIIRSKKWSPFFTDFPVPYAFYEPEEYGGWLEQVGLKAKRIELIPKDMIHDGKSGLAAWVRTTWLPYTQRVPEKMRQELIDELVDKYVEDNPADDASFIHVQAARLEVEAENIR